MPKQLDQYRLRYLTAVKIIMAVKGIELFKDVAPLLNTTDKTLSAIQNHRQYPTVQHGIDICTRFGYSANWLFLGRGEQMQKHQATLDEILSIIKKI